MSNNEKPMILVVESTKSFAPKAVNFLSDFDAKTIVLVNDILEVEPSILKYKPSFILLDIQVESEISVWIELVQQVAHLSIPIIYICSNRTSELFEFAIKRNCSEVLIEPIEKLHLFSALLKKREPLLSNDLGSKLLTVKSHFQEDLFLKSKGIFFRVQRKDIVLVEADGNYATIRTHQQQHFLTNRTISQWEQTLEQDFFLRVHRKYIVNLSMLTGIDFKKFHLMVQNQRIPFSRKLRPEFIRLLDRVF